MAATYSGLLENWSWFDPTDPEQLTSMNDRLNQNVLVGFSYEFMEAGKAEFAKGETLVNGILALIPRAIWADKPLKGGSGTMVTQYAGIVVPDSTSIGIGNIMELYINFGVAGVFVGFLVIGSIVYLLDEYAGNRLALNDLNSFYLIFIMSQTFMNVIGSFVEWGPNLVGGYLLMYAYNKFGFGVDLKGSIEGRE